MLSVSEWRWRAVLALALLSVCGLVGCAEEEESSDEGLFRSGEECLSDKALFAEKVWPEVLSATCIACHNPQGEAGASSFVLQDAYQTGFLDANMAVLREIATIEKNGEPLPLIMPIGEADHPAGAVIEKGGDQHALLTEMVGRFQSPVNCGEESEVSYFEAVDQTRPTLALRKATLLLGGRLPTAEERALVIEGGDKALVAVVERVMEEDAFYDWLMESYNDRFLTDKYLGGDEATSLLDEEDYPARFWYDELDEAQYDPRYVDHAQRFTNNSVAREPLELIAHIVRENRPFSEIITADYTMVNPFSAKVYGVEDVQFDDPTDPNEFQEARVAGIPHAGILTSPMWLQRFPTTDTNVNRHRSRMVWDFFLATDVLKLAERPIDPTAIIGHNPTMNDPNCNVCHANIDPIAGAFQNWDEEGRFRPPEGGWYAELRPPGFGTVALPWEQRNESLRWLGTRIAEDPRFVTSSIHSMYRALVGHSPLAAPTDTSDPNYGIKLKVFLEQDAIFAGIAAKFVEDNYNLKTIIKELIKTPYFRAENIAFIPDDERSAALDEVGLARFLTPEQLDRKIEAVTGYPWVRNGTQRYLLDSSWYLIFYGGIDSDSVTQRINEPNGLMANIGQRMGNEMSCMVTARDFTLDAEARRLFPHVEVTFVPEDVNGFSVDTSVSAIKQNIQFLHAHILGEELELSDPEIEFTYQLFYETWKEGTAALNIEDSGVTETLYNSCRATNDFWSGDALPEERQITRDEEYTIRAWMAVMSYMLSDYRFLYE